MKQNGEGWAPPTTNAGANGDAANAPSTSSPPAALALAAGASSDELRYRKTTAMHLWLFTYELPGAFFDRERAANGGGGNDFLSFFLSFSFCD